MGHLAGLDGSLAVLTILTIITRQNLKAAVITLYKYLINIL
jgi:hypothetical protein